MKCPFQTVKTTMVLEHTTTERVEFMECAGEECPYYGVPLVKIRQTGGLEQVTLKKCRKAEEK